MKQMTHALLALLMASGPPAAAAAQQRPEIRTLGSVVAVADSFANIIDVRHLSNGSVLVNDMGGRRVVLLDSALRVKATVADSTPATGTAYSGRVGGLIAWRGDSTLFTDPQSMSMQVIGPEGIVARTMAVPRSQDAMQLVGSPMGRPGFDARGRLVYRAPVQFGMRQITAPGAGGSAASGIPQQPDSQPVVRVDLTTRRVDTVGMIKVPTMRMSMTQAEGRVMMRSMVDPLPVVDDWVVLPDGSVAFIRGRDYRIEWVDADGVRTSSRRIPFEWQRLSDEDKVTFIDSVRVARERIVAEAQAPAAAGDRVGATAGMAGAGGGERMIMIAPGGAPPGGGGAGSSGGAARPGGMQMPQLEFIDPMDLPDYKPPFFAGAARADLEGNIWIRTIPTRAVPGGPVYDVIDRQGNLMERVQIPEGRIIVGFGAGGMVYLTAREGGVMRLEKAQVR